MAEPARIGKYVSSNPYNHLVFVLNKWLKCESAFASFPDSLQFDQGSQVHSFRIRDVGSSQEAQSRLNETRPTSEDGFIYGYSYFAQRRDANAKRGYQQVSVWRACVTDAHHSRFQRSVVILTHHQYPALFYRLAIKLGEEYQAHDVPTLEIAFHNIASWYGHRHPFPSRSSLDF